MARIRRPTGHPPGSPEPSEAVTADPSPPAAIGPTDEAAPTRPSAARDGAGALRGEVAYLVSHPFVRAGLYAWAAVGLALASLGALYVVGLVRLVVVPLVLALFPAALLAPLQHRLRAAGVPRAFAALIVLLGSIGVLVLVGFVLVPQVADEMPGLTTQVQTGLDQIQTYLDSGPFGIDPQVIRDGIERVQTQITQSEALRTGVLGAAGALAEITTMLLLLLVVLFFYLKDGDRIAGWLGTLFPSATQSDVAAIAWRAWVTVGAYFRGQILVAFVDGLFIGIGLVLLGVPLALPLGVLVFFGGLFPIVGAVVTGAVAILVALASGGFGLALAVLALVIAVQQIESNLLAPVVLGKATELHPLAVITVLTIGGILLGVLGAFLAVPVAASLARAIGYIVERRREGRFAVST